MVALVVTIVVLTQLFLWSDYPRRIAEAQVQKLLRVQASIGSVDISWFGHTRVKNVRLTLPMEESPFLTIETIDAEHPSLPMIAFDQDLRSATIEGVVVRAQEVSSGYWNLQTLAGPGSSEAARPNSQPTDLGSVLSALPEVHLRRASVELTRANGRTLHLNDIGLDLTRENPLAAKVRAQVGSSIFLNGNVALTSLATHEIGLEVKEIPAGLESFLDTSLPKPVGLNTIWSGRRTGDGVAGTLSLSKLEAGTVQANGSMQLAAGSKLQASPRGLVVEIKGGEPIALRLTSGQIVYDDQIRVDSVRGELNGGTFALAGTADPATMGSDLRVEWANVQRRDLQASGSATLSTQRDFAGRVKAAGTVRASAVLPGSTVSGSARIAGNGTSLSDIQTTFDVEPVVINRGANGTTVVPGIVGAVRTYADRTEMVRAQFVDKSQGELELSGGFKHADQSWWLSVNATDVRLEVIRQRGLKTPVDLGLGATGTTSSIAIQNLYLKTGAASLWANGSYDATLPRPLNLATKVWYDRPVTEDDEARLNSLKAEGTIEGTLSPRDLSFEADVRGEQLVFRDREIGDVDLRIRATADDEAVWLNSREMDVLGGKWVLTGEWKYADAMPPEIVATARDVPLKALGELLEEPELEGVLTRASLRVTAPSSRLRELVAVADASGADVRLRMFHAEAFNAQATLSKGSFELRPVLREKEGTITSVVKGNLDFEQPISYETVIQAFPVPLLEAQPSNSPWIGSVLDGRAAGTLLLGSEGARAAAEVTAAVTQGDWSILSLDLEVSASAKQIQVSRSQIKTLGGELEASGIVELQDLNKTTFDASFEQFNVSTLGLVYPVLDDVQGRFAGTLSVHPSSGERPLGATEIKFALRPTDARFRSISLGPVDAVAYATYDSTEQFRIVTESVALNVAGGSIKPFARLSRDQSGAIGQLVTVDFEKLDLDQLVRSFDDDGKPISGRLAGTAQLFGVAQSIDTLSGAGTIRLTESDLGNFGPVSALYSILSVGTAGSQPTGEGAISVQLEGGNLRINEASYFNRGVDARAYGTVRVAADLESASIDNVIVIGSLQPLRAIKLPLFGDLNDVLSTLQSSVTALEVSGPIKQPKIRQVGLTEVGSTFRKIILGNADSNQR